MTDRQTNRQTDKQTDRQTENSKPEATLIPVDCQGERANYRGHSYPLWIVGGSGPILSGEQVLRIANRIRLVHRYSFSQRFYEPQRPYTPQKN